MRGRKHSEPLVLVNFKIKKSTLESLKALYPKVGYSEVLRRLAESHVAKKLAREVESLDAGNDTEGTVRETIDRAD
jgi:hypothetical protein